MEAKTARIRHHTSPLSGECVLLLRHWATPQDFASLEDRDCIAEDEVYGTRDDARCVELSVRQRVKCVLVTFEATRIEDRVVGAHSECHCLVPARPCRVTEGYLSRDEIRTGYSYNKCQKPLIRLMRLVHT